VGGTVVKARAGDAPGMPCYLFPFLELHEGQRA
jgi:hypothetical protein